jgi:MYXO-CTERM domain-containing protein
MRTQHLLAGIFTGLLFCSPVQAAIITLEAELSGANEIPAADPDGSGHATVTIDTIALTVIWDVTVENIDDVVAAHIHIGTAEENGEVRIDFSGQLSGGPITDEDAALVAADPSGWYVNVHSTTFPGGAVRGQLHRVQQVPEAGGAGLMLLGLMGIAWLRRRT